VKRFAVFLAALGAAAALRAETVAVSSATPAATAVLSAAPAAVSGFALPAVSSGVPVAVSSAAAAAMSKPAPPAVLLPVPSAESSPMPPPPPALAVPAEVAASTEPAKTLISGRQMNLLNKGDAVEFVGGVKLVRGNDFLSAERMVSEEKKGLTHAWGDVYMSRRSTETGVVMEAWADEAEYDSNSSSGTLWGHERVARTRRTPPPRGAGDKIRALVMEGDRIIVYPATAPVSDNVDDATPASRNMAEAHGRVYVYYEEESTVTKKTFVWAGHAFFNGPAAAVKFWGGIRPRGKYKTERGAF